MNDEHDRTTTEIHEVRDTGDMGGVERRTVRATPSSSLVAYKIIWLVAGIIIALLALRVLLLLLGANQGAPFVDFVYGLSSVFAWPFYGIFSYTPAYGHSVFEVSSLVAIAVYALVAWGLGKLVTVTSARTDV